MVYISDVVPPPSSFYLVSERAAEDRSWYPKEAGFVPGGIIPISDVIVGETIYHLRNPVQAVFLFKGACWEIWVQGFSPDFIGYGDSPEAAYEDWRDQVHESFQDLYRKRPFEMEDEERRRWKDLEDLIDVVAYQNETPVVFRQLGQITQARPLPRQISWVDGIKEIVRLELMPAEFAAYKVGQWFEAIVERDRLSWRLRKVHYVQRTPALGSMSKSELSNFWNSLPTTVTLPESPRDWRTP
ncbi:MAG: hypothetical protein KatS3mg105_1339 [Gemmatales bacterium]|nr:MAG: hypothetical protein KatS3mg105_1339 [Gemmatales bacterium]